jgi:hypothetical protein
VNEHPIGGISGVDPLRAIDLVWTLRDIKAKRTLLPSDPDHLRELIELGLVEMRDDVPARTNAGHEVLDYNTSADSHHRRPGKLGKFLPLTGTPGIGSELM